MRVFAGARRQVRASVTIDNFGPTRANNGSLEAGAEALPRRPGVTGGHLSPGPLSYKRLSKKNGRRRWVGERGFPRRRSLDDFDLVQLSAAVAAAVAAAAVAAAAVALFQLQSERNYRYNARCPTPKKVTRKYTASRVRKFVRVCPRSRSLPRAPFYNWKKKEKKYR